MEATFWLADHWQVHIMDPMSVTDIAPPPPGGTQSLERAIGLLRAVAARAPEGARLADLVVACGLPKPTTRRLLAALAREGLIEQDEASRRYHLGPGLDALGRIAAARRRPEPVEAPAAGASAFLRPEYRGAAVPLATLLCDRHARTTGGRPALLHESVAGQTTELSFARLAVDSGRLASVLAGLGVAKGTPVAVLLPKGPELLIAALAIWRLGGVYMPLFTTYTPRNIAVRLADSGAGLVVTTGPLRHKLPNGGRRLPLVMVEGDEALRDGHDAVLFWSALHGAPARDAVATYGEGEPFALIYTSDTDEAPLGLSVPVKALAGIEQYMRIGLDLRDDDVYWNMADPAWAYGAYYGLIGPLLLGRTTLFCDGPYDVRQGYRMLTKFGVTNLTAAPSQVRAWNRAAPEGTPERLALRIMSAVGEPLPPELVAWATGTLRVPLLDQYGQRETGIVMVNRYAVVDTAGSAGQRPEDGSLGRPMPGYRVIVLDADGREAPVGQAGEIAIDVESSPLFWFDAYTNNPARSRARFRHGPRWYLTGDWAFRDADGNIHYRGRVSDAVIMQQSE